MKTYLLIINLSASGISPLAGAVIFRTIDNTRPPGAPSGRMLLDVDENGITDFEFRAFYDKGGARLQVGISRNSSILWLKLSETSNGNFNLDGGFQIDALENRPLFQYLEYSGEFDPEFSRFNLADLNVFANQGEGSFFEKQGYLGFQFEGDEGTHYGYVQLNGKRVRDFEILSYAYESEPNTAILTGAIPEPSTSLLLMALPALVWRAGRRYSSRGPPEVCH